MNEIPETTQFDVNLPKPRTHKVLIGALVAVLVLGVIGVAAAAIANRTAQTTGEATVNVMPVDTMMYFSLNPHTDQLPNYKVIADAWKDSKEARQVAAGLQLAVTQAGLNWEDDIAPWLGDRAAFGLLDLGGLDKVGETAVDTLGAYRSPGFVLALHTRDKAASDKALANIRGMLEKSIKPNGYVTNTLGDDAYRGIPLFYMTTESSYGRGDNATTRTQENLAVATINDVVVLASSRTDLQKSIDAALDGKSLATSVNYQTVMNTLPAQNVGTLYLDYSRFMPAYLDMVLGVQSSMGAIYSNIEDNILCHSDQGASDPKCVEAQQKAQQEREAAQRQLDEQMQQFKTIMESMGGLGMVMSYEPTGIRFDVTMQQDMSKLPEAWRKFYEVQQTASPNRIFGALPADSIMVGSAVLSSSLWDFIFSPDYLNAVLSSLPAKERDNVTTQLDQFQKLIGVDLKTDLLQLLDGEMAFAMLPRAQERSEFSYSLPFQFALMFDSSDAAKATASLDKIFKGVDALNAGGLKWQSLSGLPYSVITDKSGDPIFTYGVVDGRVVIGTNSDTLLAIDNAEQAPLANADTFKQATGLLPGQRIGTFYLDFQPMWNLIGAETTYDTGISGALNYFTHFKWMSAASEAPANNLSRGALHIGVGQ